MSPPAPPVDASRGNVIDHKDRDIAASRARCVTPMPACALAYLRLVAHAEASAICVSNVRVGNRRDAHDRVSRHGMQAVSAGVCNNKGDHMTGPVLPARVWVVYAGYTEAMALGRGPLRPYTRATGAAIAQPPTWVTQ